MGGSPGSVWVRPGFRRPVLVVQCDASNRSRIATVVCVALTSNLRWANAPGIVQLPSRSTGLLKDSVANASQLGTLDKNTLADRVGKVSKAKLKLVLDGINTVPGR